MLTLSPICRYEFGGSSSAGLEFAPIGLANMLNGGGAVQAVHAERVEAPGNTCASIMGALRCAVRCCVGLDAGLQSVVQGWEQSGGLHAKRLCDAAQAPGWLQHAQDAIPCKLATHALPLSPPTALCRGVPSLRGRPSP